VASAALRPQVRLAWALLESSAISR
jgi:hypothetical protein